MTESLPESFAARPTQIIRLNQAAVERGDGRHTTHAHITLLIRLSLEFRLADSQPGSDLRALNAVVQI